MKKRNFLQLAIAFAFALGASANFAADNSTEEQALKKLEQTWADAYVKRDTKFAEQMTTEDFTFIGPDGARLNKTDYLSSLTNQVEFKEFKVDEARVRVFGATAIVVGLGSVKARFGENDLNEKYSWTDVFVKQNGEWKRAAGHVTMVAQKE